MYGAFTRFFYQRTEIQRAIGLTNFNPITTYSHDLEMLRTFTEGSLKQDVWRGHDFWQPMIWSFDELTDVKNNLDSGINEEEFPTFLDYCNNVVWHRLTNLSSMYEELVREWYLPTMLAQLTSYPEVGTIIKIDE